MTFEPQQALPAGYERAAASGDAETCWTHGAMDPLSENCMQRLEEWL